MAGAVSLNLNTIDTSPGGRMELGKRLRASLPRSENGNYCRHRHARTQLRNCDGPIGGAQRTSFPFGMAAWPARRSRSCVARRP